MALASNPSRRMTRSSAPPGPLHLSLEQLAIGALS
jgi:hypothetical protein